MSVIAITTVGTDNVQLTEGVRTGMTDVEIGVEVEVEVGAGVAVVIVIVIEPGLLIGLGVGVIDITYPNAPDRPSNHLGH